MLPFYIRECDLERGLISNFPVRPTPKPRLAQELGTGVLGAVIDLLIEPVLVQVHM